MRRVDLSERKQRVPLQRICCWIVIPLELEDVARHRGANSLDQCALVGLRCGWDEDCEVGALCGRVPRRDEVDCSGWHWYGVFGIMTGVEEMKREGAS